MENIIDSFSELVHERPREHLGDTDLSFDGRLDPAIRIHEDGGESGCGGKIWIAAQLLCEYILERTTNSPAFVLDGNRPVKSVLELGSGTGLVGICVAMLDKQRLKQGIDVTITDIDQILPLMERNVELNHVQDHVRVKRLWWGEPLPLAEYFETSSGNLCERKSKIDLILLADCVYLEAAFKPLMDTLLELTNCSNPPVILMASKKRRKADKKFFQMCAKHFKITEITDYTNYEHYRKQRTKLSRFERVHKR